MAESRIEQILEAILNDSGLSDLEPPQSRSEILLQRLLTKIQNVINNTVPLTQKGAVNGVASLDSGGRVPAAQLPSYVDDIVEYNDLPSFPVIGEAGKIYIAKDTNKVYRWSGSAYIEVAESLKLGETSTTAYRGDRGKIAYEHSQDSGVHVTNSDKLNWNAKQSVTDNNLPTTSKTVVGAIGELKGEIAYRLTEPSTGMAVGKYFRIASIDENGHPVLEAVYASGGGTWGGITGTLSDQTDLNTALGDKQAKPDAGTIRTVGVVKSINDSDYQHRQTSAAENNFAKFDSNGYTVDSGLSKANFMVADSDAVYKLVTNSIIAPIILS